MNKLKLKWEVTLSKRKRELDLLHHIHVQDITVEAQRNIALKLQKSMHKKI